MRTKIRIGYLSTTYHTSLLLIATKWLENCFGIRPHWELFGGGPAIVSALADGNLDLGYVGLPPVIIGIDKGAQIKCVAGGHMEGTVLVATPQYKSLDESGGDMTVTLAQFEGQTMGVPPRGSIHDIIIRDLVEQLGLNERINRINIENYKWADLIVMAMQKGVLKIAAGTPALATAANQALGAKVIIPPSRLWPNNPSYGIVFRSEIIKNDPELVDGFLEAHRQAIAFIKEHTDEAAELVAKVIGLVDKEFVLKTFALSPKYDPEITPEIIKSTMAFIPVLQRLGYISQNLTEKDIFDSNLGHFG
jgi:NitT/TauT family transport system substrate-binding protein